MDKKKIGFKDLKWYIQLPIFIFYGFAIIEVLFFLTGIVLVMFNL